MAERVSSNSSHTYDLTPLNEACASHPEKMRIRALALLTDPNLFWLAFCESAAKQKAPGVSLDPQKKQVTLSLKEPTRMRDFVNVTRSHFARAWNKEVDAHEPTFMVPEHPAQETRVFCTYYQSPVKHWPLNLVSLPSLLKEDFEKLFIPSLKPLGKMLGARISFSQAMLKKTDPYADTTYPITATLLNIQPLPFTKNEVPYPEKYSGLFRFSFEKNYPDSYMPGCDQLLTDKTDWDWEGRKGPDLSLRTKEGEIRTHSDQFWHVQKLYRLIREEEGKKVLDCSAYSKNILKSLLDFLQCCRFYAQRLKSKQGIQRINFLFELFEIADKYEIRELTYYCLNLLKRYASFDEAKKIKEKADQHKDPFLYALYEHLLEKKRRAQIYSS